MKLLVYSRETVVFWLLKTFNPFLTRVVYLKIISRARVGYKMIGKWSVIIAVKFSNLSNGKKKPEKKKKKTRASTAFEAMTSANTGAMLYQLSYEATHWEQGQFTEFISSRAVKSCEIYMKQFIFVLRLYMKVKCDHRSKFYNLSNGNWRSLKNKTKGKKKKRCFNGIRTHDLRE